ncbi:hypothetical protein D8Y22_07630 [Salinadaptatus halalkaliphilus]|uniref:Uncharacterized protein n=1 Tax=Salinadaptatus halalkaliphilus TaxID=2419781 RepID=A0A4V3VLE4_9EURY|nr:hypothetical protein [Salinadaptatus halalkaliphilus]THE65087.1 hypothetical protein D8Y22_07630 [Salinadaptatus halalkaliphilus]
MHFDQRTQRALREVGLETDDLRAASQAVVDAVETDAAALEDFFAAHDTVYSDMELAHSTADYPEHAIEWLDLTTHADEMRGWLRFDSWGVYVEDGRILDGGDDLEAANAHIELTLGPTIHDRVRFAPARETLQ